MNTRSTRRSDPVDDTLAALRKKNDKLRKENERLKTVSELNGELFEQFEELETNNDSLQVENDALRAKVVSLEMKAAALNHYAEVYAEQKADQAQEIHELKVARDYWRTIARQQRRNLRRNAHVDPGSPAQPILVSDPDSDTVTDENMYEPPPLQEAPLDREPRDRRRVRFDR